MEDRLRVTVVATGIGRRAAARPVLVQQTLRTGTDNGLVATGGYGPDGEANIWTSPRARVEAMEQSGVERLDIPAFLRKQAD
jgi:cell division protein FtsZ